MTIILMNSSRRILSALMVGLTLIGGAVLSLYSLLIMGKAIIL